MAKIKERIPNLAVLKEKCLAVFTEQIDDFISATAEKRQVVRNCQNSSLIIFGAVLFLQILMVLEIFEKGVPRGIFVILLIISILFLFYYGTKWFIASRVLADSINEALESVLVSVLGIPIGHDSGLQQQDEARKTFKESELVTEPFDILTVDDVYKLGSNLPLTIHEMMATKRNSNEKHQRNITVFKGVLAVATLPKSLSGLTFISTEGDKSGFGHIGFWSKVLGHTMVAETTLEWNEFEKDLHVATSDAVEARYILTPDFMYDLHTWWLENKENIRLVFRENKLYMALPDTGVSIGYSTTSIKPKVLNEYLFSIAKPLWRTLTLVEDIRL